MYNKKRWKYSITQGTILAFVLTFVQILRYRQNLDWSKVITLEFPIYFIGAIILHFILLWPLKIYLERKTKERYQKEIQEDLKNKNKNDD